MMGTWGSGNLENDGAQDLISEISEELFTEVIELLKDPQSAEYDELDYNILFVKIEFILALADNGLINSSPPPLEIQSLFKTYLDRWSKYYSGSGATEEHAIERKGVIENSFENLLKVAESAESGSFYHRVSLITKKFDNK